LNAQAKKAQEQKSALRSSKRDEQQDADELSIRSERGKLTGRGCNLINGAKD
jgi:hypothetical protein